MGGVLDGTAKAVPFPNPKGLQFFPVLVERGADFAQEVVLVYGAVVLHGGRVFIERNNPIDRQFIFEHAVELLLGSGERSPFDEVGGSSGRHTAG